MPTHLSPGVYVEEIASASAHIVGVGTSVAAFIGTINANVLASINTDKASIKSIKSIGSKESPVELGEGKGSRQRNYPLPLENPDYPVVTAPDTYGFLVDGKAIDLDEEDPFTYNETDKSATVKFKETINTGSKITGYYQVQMPTIPAKTPSDVSDINVSVSYRPI